LNFSLGIQKWWQKTKKLVSQLPKWIYFPSENWRKRHRWWSPLAHAHFDSHSSSRERVRERERGGSQTESSSWQKSTIFVLTYVFAISLCIVLSFSLSFLARLKKWIGEKERKKVFKNSALVRVSSSSLLLLPSRRLLYFFTKSLKKNELKFISFLTVNFVQFAASKKSLFVNGMKFWRFFFFRRRNLCFSLQHPSLPGGLRTQTQRQQNGRTGQLDSHLHHSGKKTKKDELTVSSTRDQCYKFVS